MAQQHSQTEIDYKAFLRELLDRFRRSNMDDNVTLEQYADGGAEALKSMMSGKAWYTLEETAQYLGISQQQVRALLDAQQLPEQPAEDRPPGFHALDVSLYRAGSSQVGAKEDQVTPLPTPPEDPSQTWDPRRDLTPG
jgi:hypothetical protein